MVQVSVVQRQIGGKGEWDCQYRLENVFSSGVESDKDPPLPTTPNEHLKKVREQSPACSVFAWSNP